MREKQRMKYRRAVMAAAVCSVFFLTACGITAENAGTDHTSVQTEEYKDVEDVPEYSGEPYVEINGSQPEFEKYEVTTVAFEEYSELDELGRCGEAEACVGEEIMPTEERESISGVTPTGWENEQYEIVDGGYVYNRCHLIGFQLTGENANEENLITGTRYMNTEGMLPFENQVAEYVHETENHVMYRVTPVFEGDNLVASGVQMEAMSVEDDGEGVCFNVYVYNVQPEITIDYSTGANWVSTEEEKTGASDSGEADGQENTSSGEQTYILNNNTMKFHDSDCSSADDIKAKNKSEFTGTREKLIEEGYEPCGKCRP